MHFTQVRFFFSSRFSLLPPEVCGAGGGDSDVCVLEEEIS